MRKKITMLLVSLLACVGVAKAQPKEDQLYRIKNVATSFYLDITSTQTNGIKIKTLDEASLNQCFYFIPKDAENNVYYIKSANKQYVARVGSSLWDMCATNDLPSGNSGDITLVSVADAEGQYYLQTTSTASWGNNVAPNDDSNGAEGSSVYSDKAQTAKYVKWLFEEVQLSIVDLVVNYTFGGVNVGSTTLQGAPGGEVEVPVLDYTKIASCKIGEEEQTVTDGACTITVPDAAATITVELATNFPFEVSADYENATWYVMQIRSNNKKYVVRSESVPYANTTTTPTTEDALWAFVGNPFDGIQVLNKAAGTGKTLGLDGNNGVMTEGTTTWNITKGNGGFLLRVGNEGNKYFHDYGSKLQIWDDGNAAGDPGSAFVVTSEAEMISLATTAMGLASKLDTYAEASYYTYPNAAVAEAKATLQDVTTPTDFLTALQAKATVESVLAALNTAGKSGAPAAGDIIMLKNKNVNKYLIDNGEKARIETANKENKALWEIVAGETGVKLKNYATGRYLGSMSQSQATATVEAEAGEYTWTNTQDAYAAFNFVGSNQYGHESWSNLVGWWDKDANASQWVVTNVRPLSITYLYNDKELGTSTEYIEYGTVYTVSSSYDFTKVSACTKNEEALEAVDGVYSFEVTEATTLTVELGDDLPFVPAADVASIEHWYYIQMHSSGGSYSRYIQAMADHIEWLDVEMNLEEVDSYTWGFVGNPFDGFKLVNYGAGGTKAVSSTGSDNPALGSFETGTQWTIKTSRTNPEAQYFCFQYPGSNNYMNAQNGKIAFYDDNDQGSTMWVTERDLSGATELKALIESANAKVAALGESTSVGSVTGESLANLKTEIESAQTAAEAKDNCIAAQINLQAALDALETIQPEIGKFYTIVSACSKNSDARNGQSVYVNDEGGLNFSNEGQVSKWFQFVPSDESGKFYLYNVKSEKYLSTNKTHGGGQEEANATSTDGAVKVTITNMGNGNIVKIVPEGGAMIHAQAGGNVVAWDNTAYDEASAWTLVEVENPGVAIVGDESYATLQAAIEAAEAEETVKLLDGITLTEATEINKVVTLNRNGKTITRTGEGYAFEVTGELILEGAGSIDGGIHYIINDNVYKQEEKAYAMSANKGGVDISYIRNFGHTNWQVLYVPFAIPVENMSDFNVYSITDANSDAVVVDQVTEGTLAAHIPYLIKAKSTGEKTIFVENGTLETAPENDYSQVKGGYTFTGTYAAKAITAETEYVLTGGEWCQLDNSNQVLGAFRVYLTVNGTAAPVLRIMTRGEEDTTAIDSAVLNVQPSSVIYDLLGRRVEKMDKGIYIVNGRKVVVK